MAGLERGRSPSASQTNIRQPSPAPRHSLSNASYAGSDNNILHNHFNTLNAQATSGVFSDPSFTQDYSQQTKWSLGPTYTDFAQQEQLQQPPIVPSPRGDTSGRTYFNTVGRSSQDYGQVNQSNSNHVSPSALSQDTSPSNADSSAFPSFDFDPNSLDLSNTNFNTGASLDPSILAGFGSGSSDLLSAQQELNNHNLSQDQMASAMQSHVPTPPHLLPEMVRRQSNSPSPHATPSFSQGGFQSMNRPRNVSESLDPSSAMFPQGQNEWPQMGSYRTHRRTPSDTYSEISSHSNQASPYLATLDSFDAHSSPMLNASQDPAFNGDLGLQSFNLNENQMPLQQSYISPGHSPHHSPRLIPQPQQALPPFTADNNYGLQTHPNGQYVQQQQNGFDMFPGQGQEAFPSLNNHTSPGDLGAADQMSPPEINIDYAPPSKPVEDVRQMNAEDTLSPPLRTQSRNRMRAKSDPYAGSRPTTPGVSGRGRSPSLQPQVSDPSELLAPVDNNRPSRSPSPARGRNGSLGARARSSSNASDHRDYILDLANPERTPSTGADKGRVQKHPATFQCTLCPKRFTRAYNLRSHLRTHTDERPFVCNVCGKAFARQHDRKRHEGLHSGEKKFVCRGNLQSNQQWGCGRRFARADALGRHFRSEAGRVCIKPLLDEEAAERQRAWMEEQQQAQVAAGLVAPQPLLQQPHVDMMGNFLPAALLHQYPALANIDWNAMPRGPPPDEEAYSGRSSFDASSGGEYNDDMSENEMSYYPDPAMAGGGMNNMSAMNNMSMNGQQINLGHQAQPGAQGYGNGMYGHQAGDYLSDFEGR